MNNPVISSIVLCVAMCCDATIWGSSVAKETKPPGYLPILQVHKYNGFQINPVQGAPIYSPNEPSQTNNIEAQMNQLNQIKILQFDTINRLASFLPADFDLREMDLTEILPYADLISEDTLEKFKHEVETSNKSEKSKILKLIAFIRNIKEKKLKPFKYVVNVGSNIIHKKKNWIFGSPTTSTPPPYTENTASVTYPAPSSPYAYNPALTQFGQYFPLLGARFPPLQSFPYYQQYPIYSFSQQQQNPFGNVPSLPSANQFPPSYPANLPQFQSKPVEAPAETPSLPKFPSSNPAPAVIPQFQQFPNHNNIQFPSNFIASSLPAQNSEPTKNEITNEYKQTPASTFAIQDTNGANRQVVSFNQPELPSTAPSSPQPQADQSNQQLQYSYQISPDSTVYSPPQQPSLALPAYQPNSWYIPSSYQNTHQEPNKFYTTSSSNDLAAAASENDEKIAQPVYPISTSQNDETESVRLNNAVTSTETTISKSQQSGPKRTHLKPVQAPTRTTPTVIYPSLPKEEAPKDDVNKSSPAINASTTN